MRKLIHTNRFFFLLVAIYLLMGGIYLAGAGKPDAILFFNSRRSSLGDHFFKYATIMGEAPVYFVTAIVCLAIRLRYTLMIAITGLTVMGVSFILKEFFAEDRPLAFFRKLDMDAQLRFIEGVDVHTGATSFPSGHAMSAFALYSLIAFLLAAKKRYAAILFMIAVTVALSRVYLIQHFLEDVYAGALIGVLLAVVIFSTQAKYPVNNNKIIDRPLIKTRYF